MHSALVFPIFALQQIETMYAFFLFFSYPGLSKGVGFIRYDKKCEAELAIEKLNGFVPPGATEKITVKFANNPSSKTAASIPMALAASYFAPSPRQILGPIHHAAGRFR